MSSKAHAERLAKALETSGMCQVVQVSNTHDQIRLIMRVQAGAEKAWTNLIDQILMSGERIEGHAHSFQAHICKNYFRKPVEDGKKLVFGWYVSVQSNSMTESLDVIVKAIHGQLPEDQSLKKEVTEMPLSTRARELNKPNEKGRGGWTVGGKNDFKPLR